MKSSAPISPVLYITGKRLQQIYMIWSAAHTINIQKKTKGVIKKYYTLCLPHKLFILATTTKNWFVFSDINIIGYILEVHST